MTTTIKFWPRLWVEASYNFNKKELRGADIHVLPFLRVFPPPYFGGYTCNKGWTVHFGWLFWTVGVHTYRNPR